MQPKLRLDAMRIISWNVNGLRSAADKGFAEWLQQCGAEIVATQEVRAPADKIPPELRALHGYTAHFTHAAKPGYSGVGLYAKRAPDSIDHSLGVAELDAEARLQIARFGKLWLVNGYFPNGKGPERDNSRVAHKLNFYKKLFKLLKPKADAGEPVLVLGDFNTAHQEIDLARPKDNRKVSGFLDEERAELSRWLKAGWVDTFRHVETAGGHYSWWSNRPGIRARNVGWRIDCIYASPGAMPYLRGAGLHPDVHGSDHCPVSVDVDPLITGD
jgi:exodeoxyribonuclease III